MTVTAAASNANVGGTNTGRSGSVKRASTVVAATTACATPLLACWCVEFVKQPLLKSERIG